MYVNLQNFLPLLLFCAYGITESLGCDSTNVRFSSGNPLDIVNTLKELEYACNDAFQLIKIFDSAHQIFQRNGWTDPDKYIRYSLDYYQFQSDLETKLRNVNVLKFMNYVAMTELWGSCTDTDGEGHLRNQAWNIMYVQNIFHIPIRKNNTFIEYALHNSIVGDKASIFCQFMIREFKKPSCNLTITGNETLRIYGDYVRMSDVVDIRHEYKETDFQNIEIFASSKLIINADLVLNSDKAVNVIIMAPTWMIPTCYSDFCERWIEVVNKKNGSVFFAMGNSFIDTDMFLKIRIVPQPPSYNYLTFYNLNGPSESPVAITDFGEKLNEPNPAETDYDYHALINNYIKFILETRSTGGEKNALKAFYNYLDFKTSMFNTFGFVQELLTLEDHFFTLYRKRIPADVVYKGFNSRFDDYSFSPKPNEISFEFDELRNSIRTATWSKINVVTSNDDFELELVKYISEGITNLINMGDITRREKSKKIMMYKEDLKAKIIADIKQAEAFNQDEVIPKVQQLNEQVDVQLDNVLRAAVAIREKVVEDVQKREAQQSKLRFFRFLKSVTAMVATIAGLCSGTGAIAFIIMGTAAGSALDVIGEPEVDDVKVPGSIKNVENFIESKSRVFDHMLEILGKNEPRLLGSLKKEIKDTQEAMKEGTDVAPFEKIKKLLETKEKELKASSGASGSSKALGIVKQLQKILKLSQVASPDAYLKYRNDTTAIQVLDESSGVNDDDDVKAAILYERQIHTLIAPAIKYFNNLTSGLAKSTSGKSQAEIDVWKWKANDVLRDIRFRMREFTSSMYEGKMLLETIDKLSSALNLVFDLTDKVRVYEQFAQLIGYIGDVNAVQFTTRDYENKEIEEAISKMQYLTKYNTAIARYKKTLNSFKLYTFPFSTMLSGLTNYDFSHNYSNVHSVKDMAMNAEMQLGSMGLRMNMYKNSLTNHRDIDIVEGRFDGSAPNSEVFYTWKLGRASYQLFRLFSGKEVFFSTDLKKGLQKNAMKFKTIGIRFKANSADLQERLDKALESFEVTMTHSGESYYRCDDKFYKATTGSMTLRFSMAKDASGEPIVKGNSYKKLMNGNYLLSPYTTWKIKLESNDGSFSKLENMRYSNVDIILEGHGQYVKGRDACSNDLHRYYTLVK